MSYRVGYRNSIHIDFPAFEHVFDLEKLKSEVDWANKYKQRCYEAIKDIDDYIKRVTDHAMKVVNTEFERVIELRRRESYYEKKVYYDVFVNDVPKIDKEQIKGRKITTVEVERYNYKGTERHLAKRKAIELINKYPNAKFIQKGCELVK